MAITLYFNEKTPSRKISLENVQSVISEFLPEAEIQVCRKLSEVVVSLESKPCLVLLFNDMFQDSQKTIESLLTIMDGAECPVVVGVDFSDGGYGYTHNHDAIENLLEINFSALINLDSGVAEQKLREALSATLDSSFAAACNGRIGWFDGNHPLCCGNCRA